MKNIVVIGATGNVGRAVVLESLSRGWVVTAVARAEAGLAQLTADARSPLLATLAVDLADKRAPVLLGDAALSAPPDAVIVSMNTWADGRRMIEWDPAALQDTLAANLSSHLVAARAYLPNLPPGGVYLAIGGGTAEHLIPRQAHMSVTQAALRMMIRAFGKEEAHRGVHVKELIIAATVQGHRAQELVSPQRITAAEVARRACDVVARPDEFAGTVQTIQGA